MHRHPQTTQIDDIRQYVGLALNNLPISAAEYIKELVPIASWMPRYNLSWFWGDFIAGATVGLVVIPQSIAYATKLAHLPAEYGLYTSFMGVLVYSLFATSKDVTIGPTAVLSLVVGQTINIYIPNATGAEAAVFAATMSFWIGLVEFGLGLLQWGVVVDFVPVPVIAGLNLFTLLCSVSNTCSVSILGFTSGAGLQIIIGQLPTLTGIKGINTNNAPYKVLLEFLKNLDRVSPLDLLFGLISLGVILVLKSLSRRSNKMAIPFMKYVGFLRNTIVIAVFTAISFLLRDLIEDNLSLVKVVPSGLAKIVQPDLSSSKYTEYVFKAMPGVLIVSLLEHIAVSKTYGRQNGYTPNVNQEIVAMGLSNLVGGFVGAYPVTGSFSRSAIQSSSGSRTPFAPFITGLVVVVGLFSLTPTLYYTPNSVLAAIVIAAISELFSGFGVVKSLLEVEILDFIGFWIALLVTVFASIETAIYASVAYSLFVLLARIARPHIKILSRTSTGSWIDSAESEEYKSFFEQEVSVKPAPPGILVFRLEESLKVLSWNGLSITGKDSVPAEDRMWNDDREDMIRRRRQAGAVEYFPLVDLLLNC
ncbi:sulfate transporter family-domain-containing protein [Obelidium mucronatum]|nr:sulfate transporter family-domain-containing protein [Obelidium mucronatum]